MRIVIESQVDKYAVAILIDALEDETFAEACCVGYVDGIDVYVRCPNSMHGVIVNTAQLNSEVVAWVIRCLKDSLILANHSAA